MNRTPLSFNHLEQKKPRFTDKFGSVVFFDNCADRRSPCPAVLFYLCSRSHIFTDAFKGLMTLTASTKNSGSRNDSGKDNSFFHRIILHVFSQEFVQNESFSIRLNIFTSITPFRQGIPTIVTGFCRNSAMTGAKKTRFSGEQPDWTQGTAGHGAQFDTLISCKRHVPARWAARS